MKHMSILGASLVACTAVFSFQGAAVAIKSEGESTAAKSMAETGWRADMRAGDYGFALAKLNKVLAVKGLSYEKKAVAHINRGLANQKLELYAKAVSDYKAALSIDALSARTRAITIYNRALAYQKLKRQALAIEDFTNALYLDVEFAHAYYGRGKIMHEIGRYEFAVADFEKAIKYRHPSAHLPFFGQALAYEATQQRAKSRNALLSALLLKPDFKPALDRYKKLTGTNFNLNGPVSSPGNLHDAASATPPYAQNEATGIQKATGYDIPPAKAPPAAQFNRDGFVKISNAGPIVTSSITSAPERGPVSAVQAPVKLKLPYRYPGLTGKTGPTPQKRPLIKLTDLREIAQSNTRAIKLAEKGKNAGSMSQAASIASVQDPRTRPVKLASIGKNVELGMMKTAHSRPASSAQATSEVVDQASVAGWFVQLNSQRSEATARAAWEVLKKKYGSVLKKAKPIYQKADLGTRGTYWRLRLGGYEKRKAAVDKCIQLKRKGAECFVVKAG